MKRFFYAIEESTKRGYNIKVTVYTLGRSNGKSYFTQIGEEHASTAAYYGTAAMAANIIHNKLGYKLTEDRYSLIRKDIELVELPCQGF